MASFKEGETKNVTCKGQWFTLIYMTAVKNIHNLTKKAFYIYIYIFPLLLNLFWTTYELFSHQCLATKRTLHFVAFVSSSRCKIASEVWACEEGKNFEKKMTQQSMEFSNIFLSSPLLSLFLPLFFSFPGHQARFISVGKVLGKAFRILVLDERNGW